MGWGPSNQNGGLDNKNGSSLYISTIAPPTHQHTGHIILCNATSNDLSFHS